MMAGILLNDEMKYVTVQLQRSTLLFKNVFPSFSPLKISEFLSSIARYLRNKYHRLCFSFKKKPILIFIYLEILTKRLISKAFSI